MIRPTKTKQIIIRHPFPVFLVQWGFTPCMMKFQDNAFACFTGLQVYWPQGTVYLVYKYVSKNDAIQVYQSISKSLCPLCHQPWKWVTFIEIIFRVQYSPHAKIFSLVIKMQNVIYLLFCPLVYHYITRCSPRPLHSFTEKCEISEFPLFSITSRKQCSCPACKRENSDTHKHTKYSL